MANGIFQKAKEEFLGGNADLIGNTIKAALIDLNDIAGTITGATNATPIVITETSHGFSNGDVVCIQQVAGNLAANGKFRIANVATNTYELTTYAAGANVAGSGSYTSGGLSINLTSMDYWDDVSAGVIGTPGALTSKTVTNGVFDAADVTFTAVTGNTVEAVILYLDSGTPSTSPLIYYADQSSGAAFQITPTGSDIDIQWSASGIFAL